jgi:hypothetical protein
MTLVFVALYLFINQKELKIMQMEMDIMRKKLDQLSRSSNFQEDVVNPSAPAEVVPNNTPIPTSPFRPISIVDNVEYESSDDEESKAVEADESVTTEDIKDMLTNISEIDEQSAKDADLSLLTQEQLEKTKYDDIRTFLRSKNINSKGSKSELIKKILSISK